MTFRTSDKLEGFEIVRFFPDNIIEQPENNNYQKKTGYKLTITDKSSLFDYFNGHFEVSKDLQSADGFGEKISIINRGRPLIKRMVIKSAGKILYDSEIDDIHRIVNPKKMLENKYVINSSVFEKYIWRFNSPEDPNYEKIQLVEKEGRNSKAVPLYRYSFFEKLKDKILPPMQLTFELDLNDDEDEMFHKEVAYDGQVVVTRFYLCLPKMILKDGMYDEFVKDCFLEVV